MKNLVKKIKVIPKIGKALTQPKIFCISVQRTGTTSVGRFFMEHNYRVATWSISRRNDWTVKWFKGDYEKIFNSFGFKTSQVFEDDPWFCLDFYKVLFHRYPNSKFILIERDADNWFNSMVNHSNGKTLGNTHRHSIIYQRLKEFYDSNFKENNFYSSKIDNKLSLDESHREHYTNIYNLRNHEVKIFFEQFGKDRLINVKLEDKEKWQKIGRFFNIKVTSDYEIHANKSKK
jgi:hypothetical protein